jgi:thymidine phosphorylase
MISGRGLGPTGGTLDKLESILGFRTDLNSLEIRKLTERVGCVITGATENLAPADRKLYAVRDVTATVASIPLITASIMSKKLAEGLDALVLDVKFGSGAFMKTLDAARDLAESLVAVGTRMGVRTAALLTDMNQPLGRMIGNAVEVDEAVDVLAGRGPADVRELVLALGTEALRLSGLVTQSADALECLSDHLASGRALLKFHEMVAAQGGDRDATRAGCDASVGHDSNVPQSVQKTHPLETREAGTRSPRRVMPASDVLALRSGYIQSIQSEELGWIIIELGGGRRDLHDRIDHAVGLECLVRIGDRVERGQPIMRVFAEDDAAASVQSRLAAAFMIDDAPAASPRLIADRIPRN